MKMLYERPELEICDLWDDIVTLSDASGNVEEPWELED